MAKPDKLNIIWGGTNPGGIVDPGDTKFELGWEAEIPPYQYFNYILNKTSAMLDHVNTYGVPEYDLLTEYKLGSRVLYLGILYRCLAATSIGSLPTLLVDWFNTDFDFESRVVTLEEKTPQSYKTTDNVVFDTVNTGQGNNKLYEMDQPVKTNNEVTFGDITSTGEIRSKYSTGVIFGGNENSYFSDMQTWGLSTGSYVGGSGTLNHPSGEGYVFGIFKTQVNTYVVYFNAKIGGAVSSIAITESNPTLMTLFFSGDVSSI